MGTNLSKLWEMVKDRKAWSRKELDTTEQLNNNNKSKIKMTELRPIESVIPSSYLILCRPLLLLLPILPSIRVFSNESTLRMRWPKYWSFSFSISPSKEHPGLISFRMDWLNLLAVQGTLKSLLQQHSSKASINCIQILHPSTTTVLRCNLKNDRMISVHLQGKPFNIMVIQA